MIPEIRGIIKEKDWYAKSIELELEPMHFFTAGSVKKVADSNPVSVRAFLGTVYMFSRCMHGFSLSTPASSKHMLIRSTGDSKLPLGMGVSVISICGHAIGWSPVQSVPYL